MKLSIVVPVFNEESNIPVLYERLRSELEGAVDQLEILFVDDGSTDSSADRVAQLHRRDPRVKLLSLSRNFGHQSALTAGLDHASGDAVVVMDADMQHPPSLIRDMVARWKEGYEVVYTVRTETADAGAFKRASARLFYRVFRALSRIDLSPNVADFRLLDRRVVDAFGQIRERTRFLRGLTGWAGFRTFALPFSAPPRHSGATKYNPRRMLRFAVDGLVSFSATPLYAAIYVGLLLELLGVAYLAYVLYSRFVTGDVVPGWTSLIVLITFVGGIQLILMGIIGVYIGKIYEETKQRPIYLVRRTLGLEEPAASLVRAGRSDL